MPRVRVVSRALFGLAGRGPVVAVQGEGLLLGLRMRRPAKAIQGELLSRDILVGTSDDPERSAWPLGIPRLRMPGDAPSRSTLKLAEAFAVLLDNADRAALRPGGVLFIGGTEALLGADVAGYKVLGGNFYQKTDDAAAPARRVA